jgi:Integrase core domain
MASKTTNRFSPEVRARARFGCFRAREGSFLAVGDSYDNALAETINGLYKAEVVHRRGPWRTFEAVEFATLEWVDWFNNRRLLEPIGFIPPAEAEDSVPSTNRKGSNGSDSVEKPLNWPLAEKWPRFAFALL